MIDDFQLFGPVHVLTIFCSVAAGLAFILFSKRFPSKKRLIGILFAVFIIIVRGIRYVFDAYYGKFEPLDLLSLNVCNIDLYLLLICLVWPRRGLFVFNFLIGIPTALSVALLPGTIHPEPGLPRAILFIASHALLVMGAIYTLAIHKFTIKFRDVLFYYAFSLVGIIAVYIFDMLSGVNFMYLRSAPKGTILEPIYNASGPILYVVLIYLLLVFILSAVFLTYRFATNSSKRAIIKSCRNDKTLPNDNE